MQGDQAFFNVVVLSGRLSRPAQQRELPSGDVLVALEVSVPREHEPAETVPVVWLRAPGWAADLDQGEGIVVVGRVRRRFYRAGSGTQSRTEVVADRVVPATRTRRCQAALAGAMARVEAALAAP